MGIISDEKSISKQDILLSAVSFDTDLITHKKRAYAMINKTSFK